METAPAHRPETAHDWREVLFSAVDFGLPGPFSAEWLIDKAEKEEWAGLWW